MTEINQRVKRDFYLLRRAMAFPVYSVRFKGEKKGVAAILIDAVLYERRKKTRMNCQK